MAKAPLPRTRKLTVIAQDPSVIDPTAPSGRRILRAAVDVPAEHLQQGPKGYRVQVVDYDVSRDVRYSTCPLGDNADRFADATDAELLSNPHFHCQNAYALVMRTLARFEHALGRRIGWGFNGHHLHVVPHAFSDANAFYSPDDQAVLFGYFPRRSGNGFVFTCLSHDVVVHETVHALVDGLRERFTDPSSPDQAAFHEAFADIAALLSVFSLDSIAARLIDLADPGDRSPELIPARAVTSRSLRGSALLGLAEELGSEIPALRGNALRRSVELEPSTAYLAEPGEGEDELLYREFLEPHRRGEVLVAAVLRTFTEVWSQRIAGLGTVRRGYYNRARVVEEGARIADLLLTMVVRALDYTPPVHLEFGDFLSAVLTADAEVRPDDSIYELRAKLRASFADYGIEPASPGGGPDSETFGFWKTPDEELVYERTHFESMQGDPDEVFRFIWENRKALGVNEEAFSRVLSVRPCRRVAPDGFILRETVAEHLQVLEVEARDLRRLGIEQPAGMPPGHRVWLRGGGTLIFDEYGRLKYYIRNSVADPERQSRRLAYLWANGFLDAGSSARRSFSNLHRQRALGRSAYSKEVW